MKSNPIPPEFPTWDRLRSGRPEPGIHRGILEDAAKANAAAASNQQKSAIFTPVVWIPPRSMRQRQTNRWDLAAIEKLKDPSELQPLIDVCSRPAAVFFSDSIQLRIWMTARR